MSKNKKVRLPKDPLKKLVERIERLLAEKKELASDIKEIYKEAKSLGYETKALRAVIKKRAMDAHDRAEMEDHIDTYSHALGL